MLRKPLAIDLFSGLGGWTDGLLAEGYGVVGFDNERHVYGEERYPAQLVIQDVLTIHGKYFKTAALIVASPPCQEYSYMAMPWSLSKTKAREYADGTRDVTDLTALFDACFRIQREAIEAAGHFIPLVVENVRGAQPYVGRSKYHFGSFHLWGDVPALMPMTRGREVMKTGVSHQSDGRTNFHHDKDYGTKNPGFRFDGSGKSFQSAAVEHTGRKNSGGSWFNVAHNTTSGHGNNPAHEGTKVGVSFSGYGTPGYKAQAFNGTADEQIREGCKQVGSGAAYFDHGASAFSSSSSSRKRASAMIAKIPIVLSRHIAASWYPRERDEATA